MTDKNSVTRFFDVAGHAIKAVENVQLREISIGLKGYRGTFANIPSSELDSYVEGLRKVVSRFPAYFKALEDSHIIVREPDEVVNSTVWEAR